MKPKKILTVKESAQLLGCSLKWVFDLLYAAKLPGAEKAQGQWRIPLAAIEERLKQREARNG